MYGTAFWAHGAPMSLSWCRCAQAERVSRAARAYKQRSCAAEVYYLPAAKGSSALNYAPRRQEAACAQIRCEANAAIRARAEKPRPR